jgi:hypothetical protein
MALIVRNGPFIQADESLSDVIDCRDGRLVRITMPGNWTSAPLTFQVSTDGIYYNDLFDWAAKEIKFEVVPGAGVVLPPDLTFSLAYLKFRSGTRDNPIEQKELREFAVALDGVKEAP